MTSEMTMTMVKNDGSNAGDDNDEDENDGDDNDEDDNDTVDA